MIKSLVFQHSVSVYLEFIIVNNYFSNLNLHISLIHRVESQLCRLFEYQLKIGRLLEIVHIFLARKIICIGIYTVSLTFMLNRSSEGADNSSQKIVCFYSLKFTQHLQMRIAPT